MEEGEQIKTMWVVARIKAIKKIKKSWGDWMATSTAHRIQMISTTLVSILSRRSIPIRRLLGTIQTRTYLPIRSGSRMWEEWTSKLTSRISRRTSSTIAVLNRFFKTLILNLHRSKSSLWTLAATTTTRCSSNTIDRRAAFPRLYSSTSTTVSLPSTMEAVQVSRTVYYRCNSNIQEALNNIYRRQGLKSIIQHWNFCMSNYIK